MKIAMGPHSIEVISDSKTTVELASEGKYGDSDPGKLQIRVRGDLPISVYREVLVHELIHHAIALTALASKLNEPEEEELVRSLSPYLAQALGPALGALGKK
jgi:hypothetical protein